MSNTTTSEARKGLTMSWQLCAAFLVAAAVMVLPSLGYASSNDTPIGAIYCLVAGWMTGNTGKGIATIAVTIIGIGALLGKVSWGMALIVGLGIALVFGSAALIDAIFTGTSNAVADCQTQIKFNQPGGFR